MTDTLCACGHPQSYPIPHEHDRTERENLIVKHYRLEQEKAKQGERTIREIKEALNAPIHRGIVIARVEKIADQGLRQIQDLEHAGMRERDRDERRLKTLLVLAEGQHAFMDWARTYKESWEEKGYRTIYLPARTENFRGYRGEDTVFVRIGAWHEAPYSREVFDYFANHGIVEIA